MSDNKIKNRKKNKLPTESVKPDKNDETATAKEVTKLPGPEDKRRKTNLESYQKSLEIQRKHKVWARIMLIVGALVVGYFMKSNEKPFALFKDHHPLRVQKIVCAPYQGAPTYPSCSPPPHCARIVSDNLVPSRDAESLQEFALTFFKLSTKPKGPVAVFPISNSTDYMPTFNRFKGTDKSAIANKAQIIFRLLIANTLYLLEEQFEVDKNQIYLTHPVFISEITNNTPITIHDEYYQTHIDAETYPSFHYTALVYLSDYGKDFTGGRFIFIDNNSTRVSVEPKLGRVLIFTSGNTRKIG